ncbi:MAG: phosphotransferase [Treponema sp.]|nr:phosphotransferase [Treponema sp.]
MKSVVKNEEVTIFLEGRIDTNNSAKIEQEISDIMGANPGLTPEFDASSLEYISSAGLRILLKVAKSTGKKIKVLNASKDVYEIFETTGFTNILDVQKALREISVEGCELIGSGGYGKVYRIDEETIAKLYIPTVSLEMVRQERDTAQKAFLLGVPTAISYDVVKSGDCYGAVFELLNAKTVAQIIDAEPSRVQEMGKKSAALLKELHKIEVNDKSFPNRKEELLDWAEKMKSFLEPSEIETITAFIKSIPDANTFLHGDFNSKNVMVQGEDFVLIDIGDAAIGHPVFDVAGLILAYAYLPKSPLPDEEKYRLLGFHLEDAPAMLFTMFSEYFATTDQTEIQKKIEMIMPYANLLTSFHGSRRCNYNPDYIQQVTSLGIRQRLLPSISSHSPSQMDWRF